MSLVGDDAFETGGEWVDLDIRIVVSPATGWFDQGEAHVAGQAVHPGDVLGSVGGLPVRSAFAGTLMSMAVVSGQRVRSGERVAWLALLEADDG